MSLDPRTPVIIGVGQRSRLVVTLFGLGELVEHG